MGSTLEACVGLKGAKKPYNYFQIICGPAIAGLQGGGGGGGEGHVYCMVELHMHGCRHKQKWPLMYHFELSAEIWENGSEILSLYTKSSLPYIK